MYIRIGPQVTCSVRKIFMCCTMENPEIKRRIKLMNNSDVAATFMFNIDERHKSFQLDTRYGIINPWSYKYITITFTSSKEGRYTYYLVVLILYQVNETIGSILIYNFYRLYRKIYLIYRNQLL